MERGLFSAPLTSHRFLNLKNGSNQLLGDCSVSIAMTAFRNHADPSLPPVRL